MKTLADRLAEKREAKNLSQSALARNIGISPQAIQKIEAGETKDPRHLLEIARELDTTPEYLKYGKQPPNSLTMNDQKSEKVKSVPIRGVVKAGQWQAIEDWEGHVDEHVPSSGDYPLEWQYAFIVEGESLNKIAQPGDRLVCLDLIKSGVVIDDNDLVIVEQTGHGGQFVRRSAKRVRKTIRGLELWPESTHADHQEPLEYKMDGDPEHNSVVIIAKVIWILRKP